MNLFKLPIGTQKFYKDNFKELYRKQFIEKKLESEKNELYRKIVFVSALEDLYNWVSEVQSELELKKISENKGSKWKFWKYFSSESKPQLIQTQAKENKSYVWLVLNISLISGSLALCQIKESQFDYEGLLFRYENLYFESKLRLQGGSISLSVNNLILSTCYDQEVFNVFEKLKYEEEPLMNLMLDMNPIDEDVQYKFELSTQPISADYSADAAIMISSFFILPETQESVKTAAWDTLQNLQDSTTATLTEFLYGETRYSMKIKLRCPHIRIPSGQYGKFLLNLGVIDIVNTNEESLYETINVSISGIQLDHLHLEGEEKIIPELQMNWRLSFLKSSYKSRKWENLVTSLDSSPDFLFEGELYELKIFCQPSFLSNVKGLVHSLDLGRVSTVNSSEEIMKKCIMSSWLQKKSKNLQQWNTYFAVLSGGYIYFFIGEDSKFPVSYYYIKDCSISDTNNLGISYCIILRNRYGECYLSLNTEIELHFWKRSLTEQINEFESYKSVAEEAVEDGRIAHKQRIRVSFEVPLFELTLASVHKQGIVNFQLEKLTTDVIISPFEKTVNVGLHKLCIVDIIRLAQGSKNEHFNILAQSISGESFLTAELKHFSLKSPNYANKDMDLDLKLSALEVNWNPDLISSIINFLEFSDYDPLPKPALQKLIVHSEHTFICLNLRINTMKIYLNNVKKKFSIGLISINQINLKFWGKDGGSQVLGDISKLEISDLTNYPKSAKSLNGVTKLLSVSMNFEQYAYNENHPDKKEKVSSAVKMTFNELEMFYYSQPFLRIIDYLMYRVLGISDMNSRVKNLYTFHSGYRLSSLLPSSSVQAIKSSVLKIQPFKAEFTSISITVNQPKIHLNPRPNNPEGFTLNLSQMHIHNSQFQDSTRGSDLVWIDLFTIQLNQMEITSRTRKLLTDFNISIKFHRPCLSPHQLLDSELDKSYTIKCRCERLLITFTQEDFTLLLKLMDLNLTYDDQLDEYINPKVTETLFNPNHKFLFFVFKAKVLSLLLAFDEEELVEIFFANQEVKMWKYNNGSSVLNFVAQHWLGLIPEEAVNSENPEHAEIAEAIFSVSMDNIRNFEDFEDDDMRLSYVLFGPICNEDPNKPTLQIDINTLTDGSKTVIIDITQLRLNLHLAAIMQLQNFIYYGFPDYTILEDTPYDYMNKYRPALGSIKKEVKTQYLAPELELKLSIQEPIVLLPSIIHQRVLVVQSDFSYTFFRDSETMYLINKTPNTVKTFEAAHLEVYTCKLTELSKHSFTDIVKRKILEPVEVIYKSIQVKLSPKISSFDVKYHMGAFLFTLSHKDMLLIHNIFSFQQEILSRESELISALLKNIAQREDFIARMSLDERSLMLRLTGVCERQNTMELDCEATDEHDYSPIERSLTLTNEKIIEENSASTTFSMAGITLLFIYDTSVAYAPVIDLNCTDLIFNIEEIGSEKIFKSGFLIKSNFYNPLLDTWEPFIEPVGIHIEILNCPENNPQTRGLLIVEKSTILNINFSEVMIRHYLALAKGWRVKEDSLKMEVVSPLSIRNFSGCKLLIEKSSYCGKQVTEIIELNDSESRYIEVESMHMKSINLSKEFLNVSVLNEMGYTSIKNIPINKVQSLSKEVMDDIEVIPVVLDIELKETTKVFTVRSSVVIKNETSLELKFLFSRDGMFEERFCKSQESVPVPIQFVHYMLGIRPVILKSHDWSMVSIPEINAPNTVKEIKADKFFFWIYTSTDSSNPLKSTLLIRPPMTFMNSLSKPITLQLFFDNSSFTKEVPLKPGGVYNEHTFSGNTEVSCILIMENFQKSKKKLLLTSKKEKRSKSIKLLDSKNDQIKIQLYLSTKGCQIFTLYSAVTIINNTLMSLQFIYQQSHLSHTVGGQFYSDSVVHCGLTKKIAVCVGKEKSGWLHVETVGTEDIVEFEGEELDDKRIKYQFAYSVSLANVLENELLFSKIVLIVPRYILINNMLEDINVKQYRSNKGDFLLEKNSRIPFHWPDSEMPQMIRIRVTGQWNWSGPFNLSNIGAFTIQNRHKVMVNHFLLISVEVKLVERSFYVIFEQEDEKFCNYCIENHTKSTFLKVYQKGYKEETRYLDPDSLISFAWTRPQADHDVLVEFCEDSYDENMPVSSHFSFDKINQSFTVILRDNRKVYAKIECEGPTKILKFSDTNFNIKKHDDDFIISQYYINIQHFGVSVIEYNKDEPHELLYFFASNIVFYAQETIKQWAVELQVNTLQLDNQISIPAIYPVILSPNSPENKTILHISLIYNTSPNPNIYCFEKCEFLLQELSLKLESKVLQKTIEMLTRLMFNSNAIVSLTEIYKLYEKPVWMLEEKIELNKLYYFASLSLSPIKILLSLIPIKEDESDVYGKVSKALGMAITTIDVAPVKLNTLQMTDVFGSQWQVWTALKSHYGKQLIAELISLIGHAEILGNPIGLLNNLGTGVKDFFYEPAHGIINGPLSAGKGLIKGTGSLVRNTVEGTFDTFSKLANSMATGITTLTQDREYLMIRQREQARNRPRNIVDGVEMGVRSLFSNLGQGITGVISEPVKGYRKNRFAGFLLGSFRGLSGLVVKPMAGVLDVASKAAEGIKNTAGPTQIFGKYDRKRPPRVFYGKNLIIKNYNYEESQAFFTISEIKKNKYLKEKFVAYAEGFDLKGIHWHVFLFINKIVLFNVKKKKVKWEIPVKAIKRCELMSKGLCVTSQPSTFAKTPGKTTFVFPISDLRTNRFLAEKIAELIADE